MYYIFYGSLWGNLQTAMYKKDNICEIILEGKEENNKWWQIITITLINGDSRTFSRSFENKKEAEKYLRSFFSQHIEL